MTRIVGIGGKLASGKDAISDHLVEKHGWVKFGMSDPLAKALHTLDPWVPVGLLPKRFNKTQLWALKTFFGIVPEDKLFQSYKSYVDSVGYVDAKTNDEVRRLLQVLGTEVGRKQLSEGSLWTDIATRNVRAAAAAGAPGVILTGIRFPNELEMVEDDLEGETWWVHRPMQQAGETAAHSSENSVSAVDFELTIYNDGTLDDLYAKVDKLVS